MGQLVIYYDPKSRLGRNEHMPKDMAHASLHVEAMPEDPDEIKALAEKLANMLLAALTA